MLCFLSVCTLVACTEEEDPGPILDACNLPAPCAYTGLPETGVEPFPLENAVCVHDALALAAPARFSQERMSCCYDATSWHLFTAGNGTGVLITYTCEDVDGDESCEHKVERCTLKPIEQIECLTCKECWRLGLQPSDILCGSIADWCSELVPIEPACP